MSKKTKSKDAASKEDATAGLTGSAYLSKLVEEGENVNVLGELCGVPWSNYEVDGLIIDNEGTRQRGTHQAGVTETSIRTIGYQYDRGTMMRAWEKPWTDDAWLSEIEAGRVPDGTKMPVVIKKGDYPPSANGLPQIQDTDEQKDMQFRRFTVDDGNHRTTTMHQLLKECHRFAQTICERGVLLLDPNQDIGVKMFTSILANVKQAEMDLDFLADKLGQIKAVCMCLFVSVTPKLLHPPPTHAHTVRYTNCTWKRQTEHRAHAARKTSKAKTRRTSRTGSALTTAKTQGTFSLSQGSGNSDKSDEYLMMERSPN